jgi:cyanophycinase
MSIAATVAARQPSPSAPPEVGPANGTLIIVGGGLRDDSIRRRFVQLAGGPDASIVLIPTAVEGDGPVYYAEDLNELQQAGARHVTVLHTRDRAVADSETFVAPLRAAGGVFIMGGRHWRLADAYLNTRTHAELRALLDRGGVICGTSAGATIQGSFMVRGDTKGNEIMIGDHVEGFGFLKNVTIDQHLMRRNRQFDLVPVIKAHPHLLGLGIDEDTAIVVRQDRFEVIGQSYVAVYDHGRQLDSGGPFYLLAPGDRYNLKTREPERPRMQTAPLERVVKTPWKP